MLKPRRIKSQKSGDPEKTVTDVGKKVYSSMNYFVCLQEKQRKPNYM